MLVTLLVSRKRIRRIFLVLAPCGGAALCERGWQSYEGVCTSKYSPKHGLNAPTCTYICKRWAVDISSYGPVPCGQEGLGSPYSRLMISMSASTLAWSVGIWTILLTYFTFLFENNLSVATMVPQANVKKWTNDTKMVYYIQGPWISEHVHTHFAPRVRSTSCAVSAASVQTSFYAAHVRTVRCENGWAHEKSWGKTNQYPKSTAHVSATTPPHPHYNPSPHRAQVRLDANSIISPSAFPAQG